MREWASEKKRKRKNRKILSGPVKSKPMPYVLDEHGKFLRKT